MAYVRSQSYRKKRRLTLPPPGGTPHFKSLSTSVSSTTVVVKKVGAVRSTSDSTTKSLKRKFVTGATTDPRVSEASVAKVLKRVSASRSTSESTTKKVVKSVGRPLSAVANSTETLSHPKTGAGKVNATSEASSTSLVKKVFKAPAIFEATVVSATKAISTKRSVSESVTDKMLVGYSKTKSTSVSSTCKLVKKVIPKTKQVTRTPTARPTIRARGMVLAVSEGTTCKVIKQVGALRHQSEAITASITRAITKTAYVVSEHSTDKLTRKTGKTYSVSEASTKKVTRAVAVKKSFSEASTDTLTKALTPGKKSTSRSSIVSLVKRTATSRHVSEGSSFKIVLGRARTNSTSVSSSCSLTKSVHRKLHVSDGTSTSASKIIGLARSHTTDVYFSEALGFTKSTGKKYKTSVTGVPFSRGVREKLLPVSADSTTAIHRKISRKLSVSEATVPTLPNRVIDPHIEIFVVPVGRLNKRVARSFSVNETSLASFQSPYDHVYHLHTGTISLLKKGIHAKRQVLAQSVPNGFPFRISPKGPDISQIIFKGYAACANVIGQRYGLYRPSDCTAPISAINYRDFIQASFTPDWSYTKFSKYANPLWIGVFDGRYTQTGDYLVLESGDTGIVPGKTVDTFFVASQDTMLPIMCVRCNHILTVKRPETVTSPGYQPTYGGDVLTQELTIMTGWPAAMLQGTKGEKGPLPIPDNERLPWYKCWIPSCGSQIRSQDVVYDENGHKYKVASVELTNNGYRLDLMLEAS